MLLPFYRTPIWIVRIIMRPVSRSAHWSLTNNRWEWLRNFQVWWIHSCGQCACMTKITGVATGGKMIYWPHGVSSGQEGKGISDFQRFRFSFILKNHWKWACGWFHFSRLFFEIHFQIMNKSAWIWINSPVERNLSVSCCLSAYVSLIEKVVRSVNRVVCPKSKQCQT